MSKETIVRSRVKGGFTLGSHVQPMKIWENCSMPTYVSNGSGWTPSVGERTTMIDSVVKGFHKRRAKGEVFFNPMYKVYTQLIDSGGIGIDTTSVSTTSCSGIPRNANYYTPGNPAWVYLPKETILTDGLAVPLSTDPLDPERKRDLEIEVATRCMNSRGRSDANLFESLAEADQTLGLFNKPFSRVSKFLREASKLKRAGKVAGHAANGMSNLWLIYRYAILPALNDIEAVTQGLKKETGTARQTTRAKGSIHGYSSTDTTINDGIWRIVLRTTTESDYTVRCMSLDDIDLSFANNLGFTSKGLITLPWELISHSFVADWFANFGDYLGALVPSPGWNQVGACKTVIQGILTDYTIISCTNTSPGTYVMNRPMSGSFRKQVLIRSRAPLLPQPGIVIKSDFRFDKATRLADAAALLSKQILRVFR